MIENYSITENSCKVGNCYNGYGTRILDNIIGEGIFIDGALNGFGIRAVKDKSVIYAGQFKNGYVNGAGIVHLQAENKIYFVTSKNGEFLTSKPLGFSSDDSEKDDQFNHFLENMKTKGHLVLTEEDIPYNKLKIVGK